MAYKLCQEMNTDEKQKFDLSDHNLIEISLKLNDIFSQSFKLVCGGGMHPFMIFSLKSIDKIHKNICIHSNGK